METLKTHNPKAYAPAVYIPAWLIQVPSRELSYSSKLVYGRLAQWATSQGKAHRSAKQLSEELGMPARTVESCLNELRVKKLIGSYQAKDGGHNHFEFYDHEFMHRKISQKLCYKDDKYNAQTPDSGGSATSAEGSATSAEGSATSAEHKIKEIKRNKITTTTSKTETKKDDKLTGESSMSFSQKALGLKPKCDNRRDAEFLAHVEHHIENNSDSAKSRYQREQMILKLLLNLYSVGHQFKSHGFKSHDDEKQKAKNMELKQIKTEYSMYKQGFLYDRDFLKIESFAGREPKTFDEWLKDGVDILTHLN